MTGFEVKYFSHRIKNSDAIKQDFEWPDSSTDISGYRPDISSTRAAIANGLGSPSKKLLYDFQGGEDDGSADVAMFLRQKFVDRVELDNAYKSYLKDIKAKAAADQQKLKDEYERQQRELESQKEESADSSDSSQSS